MNDRKLYYLAHPYTPINGKSSQEHVDKCISIANDLMNSGYIVFAPIVMTHPMHCTQFRSWETWMKYNEIFMEKCDCLILAGNWKQSKGCLQEKEYFENAGKEIIDYQET